MFLDSSMPAYLVPTSSGGKTCLARFTGDAERSLAALYYVMREKYNERAAHRAADEWLRIFEQRLEEAGNLPELKRITTAAIVHFVSTIAQPSASVTPNLPSTSM